MADELEWLQKERSKKRRIKFIDYSEIRNFLGVEQISPYMESILKKGISTGDVYNVYKYCPRARHFYGVLDPIQKKRALQAYDQSVAGLSIGEVNKLYLALMYAEYVLVDDSVKSYGYKLVEDYIEAKDFMKKGKKNPLYFLNPDENYNDDTKADSIILRIWTLEDIYRLVQNSKYSNFMDIKIDWPLLPKSIKRSILAPIDPMIKTFGEYRLNSLYEEICVYFNYFNKEKYDPLLDRIDITPEVQNLRKELLNKILKLAKQQKMEYYLPKIKDKSYLKTHQSKIQVLKNEVNEIRQKIDQLDQKVNKNSRIDDGSQPRKSTLEELHIAKDELEKAYLYIDTLEKINQHDRKNIHAIFYSIFDKMKRAISLGFNETEAKKSFEARMELMKNLSNRLFIIEPESSYFHIRIVFENEIMSAVANYCELYDCKVESEISISVNVPRTIVQPLSMFILEILRNSYKHAFKNKDQGKIVIILRPGPKSYVLFISDNGPGYPDSLDINALPRHHGLEIAHGLAQKLEASVNLFNAYGACCELIIPNPNG